MKIYCVRWVDGGCGLSGVVVAEDEAQAISLLELTYGETDIAGYYMGESRPDVDAHVVCKESM